MNEVTVVQCVLDCPRSVTQFLEPGQFRLLDGPLRFFIEPPQFGLYGRFSIRINDHFNGLFLKTFSELGNEEFRSTVVGRRDRDERRGDESNSQMHLAFPTLTIAASAAWELDGSEMPKVQVMLLNALGRES